MKISIIQQIFENSKVFGLIICKKISQMNSICENLALEIFASQKVLLIICGEKFSLKSQFVKKFSLKNLLPGMKIS